MYWLKCNDIYYFLFRHTTDFKMKHGRRRSNYDKYLPYKDDWMNSTCPINNIFLNGNLILKYKSLYFEYVEIGYWTGSFLCYFSSSFQKHKKRKSYMTLFPKFVVVFNGYTFSTLNKIKKKNSNS